MNMKVILMQLEEIFEMQGLVEEIEMCFKDLFVAPRFLGWLLLCSPLFTLPVSTVILVLKECGFLVCL